MPSVIFPVIPPHSAVPTHDRPLGVATGLGAATARAAVALKVKKCAENAMETSAAVPRRLLWQHPR